MNLAKAKEELVLILKTEDKKAYAFISKDSKRLDEVKLYALENCDLSAATTAIFLTHPIGIHQIPKMLDGVFVDNGCTSEEHLNKHLKFNPGAKVIWLEVEDGK